METANSQKILMSKRNRYVDPSKLRIRNFWINDFGNHHSASTVSGHMSAVCLAGFLAEDSRITRGYALPHGLLRNDKVLGHALAEAIPRGMHTYTGEEMDKALKHHLQELHREARAFLLSRLEKKAQHDALREAYFSVPSRFRPQPAPGRYEREPWPDHLRGIPCGATTRAGTPCKITVLHRNWRCKLHGGMSTGAKTKAGRKRQRDGYRAWQERQKASKAGRKRTRIFTGDAPGIDGSTLAEIRTSKAGDALPAVRGIALRFTGEQLSALLADGHCVNVLLATTSPNYGGVRWWYVCPACAGRKASLYVSGTSLCCRQCAGLHYASQSK